MRLDVRIFVGGTVTLASAVVVRHWGHSRQGARYGRQACRRAADEVSALLNPDRRMTTTDDYESIDRLAESL